MKKTLLTVALACLATTAFANVNVYTATTDNGSAKFYVGAKAELKTNPTLFHLEKTNGSVKFDGKEAGPNTTAKSGDVYTRSQSAFYRSRNDITFGGAITDANNLTYHFDTKLRYEAKYTYVKDASLKDGGLDSKKVESWDKTGQKHKSKFSFRGFDLGLSSDKFGMLDYYYLRDIPQVYGDNIVPTVDNTNLTTLISLDNSSFDNVVLYQSPVLGDSFGVYSGLGLTYGNSAAGALALGFQAKAYDTSFVGRFVRNMKNDNTTYTSLSVENSSLFDGLTLGGLVAYKVDSNLNHELFYVKADYTTDFAVMEGLTLTPDVTLEGALVNSNNNQFFSFSDYALDKNADKAHKFYTFIGKLTLDGLATYTVPVSIPTKLTAEATYTLTNVYVNSAPYVSNAFPLVDKDGKALDQKVSKNLLRNELELQLGVSSTLFTTSNGVSVKAALKGDYTFTLENNMDKVKEKQGSKSSITTKSNTMTNDFGVKGTLTVSF